MSKREYFLRYSLIIKFLQKGQASFDEINGYLVRESEIIDYNLSISKRTFQRDLNEIRDIFKIDIQYNRSLNKYLIDNIEKSDVTNRMMEAFDLFNALNITDDFSRFINLEKQKPQGVHHFHGLLHCIKNQLVVQFSYHKFEDDIITKREAEPYALKEFKGRWYILAKDIHDRYLKTFGLDRIQDLVITNKKFDRSRDFNLVDFFRDYFGITNSSDSKCEEIILSFDSLQGKYIKSFPLHISQEILVDNVEEIRVKLSLHITYDFLMELLSFGERVKVLSPSSLKLEMCERYNRALALYR